MVRVPPPAKLRPWSELTAKMVMGAVLGLVSNLDDPYPLIEGVEVPPPLELSGWTVQSHLLVLFEPHPLN